MERPPSQTENLRPTGLRPPSKLPALTGARTLQETTSSNLNARTGGQTSMLPPPTSLSASIKHKIAGLPEPPAKEPRRTLVDRAGEPANPPRTHVPHKSSISNIAGFNTRPSSSKYSTYRAPSNVSSVSSIGSMRPSSRPANGYQPGAVRPPTSATQLVPEDDQELDADPSGNGSRKAWDTKGRVDDLERMYSQLQKQMDSAADSKTAQDESLSMYKSRVQELQTENRELASQIKSLSNDLERARSELHTTTTDLRQVRRDHERELHETSRRHEREVDELQTKHENDLRRIEREREKEADLLERKMEEERKAWQKQTDEETANLTTQHWDEMEEVRTEHEKALSKLQKEVDTLQHAGESRATESATEVQLMRDETNNLQSQLDASNATNISLRSRITTYEAKITAYEQEKLALISKTHFLEGNQEAQSQEFTDMREKLEEAISAKEGTLETLRKEEALRRKLNALILELRGNIRVFVRTRPLLKGEDDPAKVEYLDEDSLEGCKEMVVHAPTTQTATGKQRNEKHTYAFDRIFAPGTSNPIVFRECQELIQSVVDGYNVSILSYGQTGSGKTYGMTGPEGIIPSAVRMLLSEMGRLKEKGWEYAVEASFVEVYNETLNDLLGDAKTWDDAEDLGASVRGKKKEKHEIHHDTATGKTTVTNLTSIGLWPPPSDDGNWPPAAPVGGHTSGDTPEGSSYTEMAVANLLDTAAKNRRVAATKANERSSRSHSIFMLTLKGSCASTNESSEGVLNLVDLAGSERLKQSGAEGSRMKETQAINKSLSSLGDVIAALGNKSGNSEAHVPYRNSKLTYLLQSSLGGTTAGKSSRTLMLLHLSPLQAHWQESRSSLLFGSKVHGTHIGTAKKR